MKSKPLPALVLTLLASGIYVASADESPGQATQPEAPVLPSPAKQQSYADYVAELEANIARLEAEKLAIADRLLALNSDPPSSPIRIDDFSSGEVVFVGLAEIGVDGKPHMIATWKGRLPSDFGSYLAPNIDHGLWLIGRIGNSIARDRKPTRFCYQVNPDGEVMGIAQSSRLELELATETKVDDPNFLHPLGFKAPTLCPPMKLEELRAKIAKADNQTK